jgi:TIR domain/FHA domain
MDKRPLKVFLCHAHADRDPVRALYTRLTNDGVDAWFDKEKLLPGQDWELEIKKAVRKADVVVVCLSMQFNQRGFRQKEVRLALDTAMEKPEGEIFIIPARLEECDTLESLKKWHEVNLFKKDGYEKLIKALGVRAGELDIDLLRWMSDGKSVSLATGSEPDSQGSQYHIYNIPFLVGIAGEYKDLIIPILNKRMAFGRHESNDLRMVDRDISPFQAIIFIEERGNYYKFIIKDEDSSLGTFLNRERIPENVGVDLKSGDRIFFGKNQIFDFFFTKRYSR